MRSYTLAGIAVFLCEAGRIGTGEGRVRERAAEEVLNAWWRLQEAATCLGARAAFMTVCVAVGAGLFGQ